MRLVCRRARWLAWALVLGAGCWSGVGCGRRTVEPTPRPTAAVAPIRHRDALPLLLTVDDLGSGYRQAEAYRLGKGVGWSSESTRLSGYRAVYTASQGLFSRVTSQVECYLSIRDAQIAYRAYKGRVGDEIKSDSHYTVVNEREESALGEWGWVFEARDVSTQTLDYVYLVGNVLIESVFTGPQASELAQEALRVAQMVNQRIEAPD